MGDDSISRQAAIDAICKAGCGSGYCGISCDDVKALEQLPPVQPEQDAFTKWAKSVADRYRPERKKGKWIIKTVNTFELAYGSTGYEPVYECSVCGGVEESYLRLDEPIMPDDADFPNYCPNCGADMRGEECL